MAKETEIWENDQILDPERKLAEIESAPPSEPEQVPTAIASSSATQRAENVEASLIATAEDNNENKAEPATDSGHPEALAATEGKESEGPSPPPDPKAVDKEAD